MNKEEIDIWLKYFANKQTGYQMFDENGTRREINFFIVFLYLKELQQKVNQLEEENNELKSRNTKAFDYIDIQFDINGVISKELKEILRGSKE